MKNDEQETTFIVRKMIPKGANTLRLSWIKLKQLKHNIQRSYRITNDEHCYRFLCKL